MVEEAALEMPYTGIPRIEGSNPSRSDFVETELVTSFRVKSARRKCRLPASDQS